MRYHAVIPTIGLSGLLGPLVTELQRDAACELISVPCNDGRSEHHPLWEHLPHSTALGKVRPSFTEGTIYDSWNAAMDTAQEAGADLAILNDDVHLECYAIHEALRYLDGWGTAIVGLNYLARTVDGVTITGGTRSAFGSYRNGGIGGHAFVVDPIMCPRVDLPFRLWYGDDRLVQLAIQRGQLVKVALGAPVDHPIPSTSVNAVEWRDEAIAHDTALWESCQ